MKNTYQTPEFKITIISSKDIIQTSAETDNIGNDGFQLIYQSNH